MTRSRLRGRFLQMTAALLCLSCASAWALDAPVLPRAKPDTPAPALEVVTAKVLPTRKPAYFGPFGRDYNYLLNEEDREKMARALDAAEDGRWQAARRLVEDIDHPRPSHLIAWMYLSASGARADFDVRAEFIADHADWPGQSNLRRKAEDVVDGTENPAGVIAWFAAFPPLSGRGMAELAVAHRTLGDENAAVSTAKYAWLQGTFTRSEERDFLRNFDDVLTEADHKARLERLLWDRHDNSANRMLRRVDEDTRRLAEARITLFTSAYGVDRAIANVPESLQADPGLIFDRIRWRRIRNRYDDAMELFSPDIMGQGLPNPWWGEARILAREALDEGRVSEAYRLAANHGQIDALEVSEAEWLAGWIALEFLKDTEAALPHFKKMYDAVQFPVSLSRGAYWAGRALDAAGKTEEAKSWYRKAAVHITTYYGQLAAARLTTDTVPQLPLDPLPTITERSTFHEGDLAQVVRLLAESGNDTNLRAFVLAAAARSDYATGRHLAAEMASLFGRPDLGVWVARRAIQDHITLVKYGFPVPAYDYPTAPEKALTLAIIRQESNFYAGARSSAGARGLMQLMPATARGVSRQTRQDYSRSALTDNPSYNISLGTAYLAGLIDDFDGSYIMAIAGYNAGPHRVRRWVREFGDPRTLEVDPINWVEQIPFTETRNYVQRVMENLQVYRAVLENSQQLAQTLEQDLSR